MDQGCCKSWNCKMLETVPSLGRFYHADNVTKRRLLPADKVLCESVLQVTVISPSFRLSSLNGMKAIQAGWINSPWPIAAWKLAKLFTEAYTNKQGSLTSETFQPTPAQIGSVYSAELMCMLHESLVCVECIKHEEAAWETCRCHSKGGLLVRETCEYHSEGEEYGAISERPMGTTADWRGMVLARERPASTANRRWE